MARKKPYHMRPAAERFMLKLQEQNRWHPGMPVRVERMPSSRSQKYAVRYISPCNLDLSYLEQNVHGLLGNGSYFLTFVDAGRQPLQEFGSKWLYPAFEHDESIYGTEMIELEQARAQMRMAGLELRQEQKQKGMEHTAKLITGIGAIAATRQQNIDQERTFKFLLDAMEQNGKRPNNVKEIFKFLQEQQNEQNEAIRQRKAQRAEGIKKAVEKIMAEAGVCVQPQEQGTAPQVQIGAAETQQKTSLKWNDPHPWPAFDMGGWTLKKQPQSQQMEAGDTNATKTMEDKDEAQDKGKGDEQGK